MERISYHNYTLRRAEVGQDLPRPFLTPDQRKVRLEFAQANENRNWHNVIFSDENSYSIDRRVSASMWGWISREGPGEMTFLSGSLNGAEYTQTLEHVLIPSVETRFGSMENVIFLQDNHPAHKCKHTLEWFTSHPKITVLNAPFKSADLNLFDDFSRRMRLRISNILNPILDYWTPHFPSVLLRNRLTLEATIVQNWEMWRGEKQYFENLYNSMPYRLREVIKNNGGPTSY